MDQRSGNLRRSIHSDSQGPRHRWDPAAFDADVRLHTGMKGHVNYRVGLFVRVPGRIGSSARQFNTPPQSTTLFSAPTIADANAAQLLWNQYSGNLGDTNASVRTRFSRACPPVNWPVG